MAAAKKTKGLGRGLDALFGDLEVDTGSAGDESPAERKSSGDKVEKNDSKGSDGISYISINDIKPNTNQPRKTFDEEKLDELAASIKAHGLIQPIVLRNIRNGYEIVAGERRWRAARKIGIKEVPCIIRELTDEENMLLAIIENMQREDLDPIEEAEGISQMMDTYGLTQEQVSRSVGKSRPYIANALRLLKLPERVRRLVSDGSLSAGHARAIVSAGSETRQIEIAEAVVKNGLSVRQTEKMAQEKKTPKRSAARAKQKDADVRRVEEDLKEVLGTKVNLSRQGRKGRIEIEFYSSEDLERLIELLKTLA